jgi:mRNA-degrading endonuclease RelE of RelBE toxin-antitoxin system
MSYKITTIPSFDRKAKNLVKKYSSLTRELIDLKKHLENNPSFGIPLGQDCYKIRLSIASKGKGKSGGARVVTHVHVTGETVYLLTIYDKGEQESINDKDLLHLINSIH